MDDILVVTTEEIGRTETNMVLYWVDRGTGPGFSDTTRRFGLRLNRSAVDTRGLIDETFQIHDTM